MERAISVWAYTIPCGRGTNLSAWVIGVSGKWQHMCIEESGTWSSHKSYSAHKSYRTHKEKCSSCHKSYSAVCMQWHTQWQTVQDIKSLDVQAPAPSRSVLLWRIHEKDDKRTLRKYAPCLAWYHSRHQGRFQAHGWWWPITEPLQSVPCWRCSSRVPPGRRSVRNWVQGKTRGHKERNSWGSVRLHSVRRKRITMRPCKTCKGKQDLAGAIHHLCHCSSKALPDLRWQFSRIHI